MSSLARLLLALLLLVVAAPRALAQDDPDPPADPPVDPAGEGDTDKPESDIEVETEGPFTPKKGKTLVRIEPLADGLIRQDEWAVVRVKVANGRGSTSARVEIRETDINEGETMVYGRDIELPQGTVKAVDLYYRPGWNSRSRKVLIIPDGGAPVDFDFFTTTMSEENVTIGVIGDDPLGLPIVQNTWMRPVPGRAPRPYNDAERQVRMGLIPLANLPSRSTGYAALDWIAWPEADPSRVDPEQLDALRAWVADGGHLLVSVSDKWQIVRGSKLHDMLPIELSGVSDADTAKLLQALSADDKGGWGQTALVQPTVEAQPPTPVAESQLREAPGRWSDTIATLDDGRPAWAVGSYGLGTVHVITASPALAPLSSELTREQLWRRLLWLPPAEQTGSQWLNNALAQSSDANALGYDLGHALRMHEIPYDSPLAASNQYNYNMWGNSDMGWESELRASLSDMPGVAPLPLSWLIGFSLLYLLAIGPADYFLLRLIKKQPWTWITFPITIAVFSAVALVGTAMIKGNQAIAQRLEVVDILPGTDLWRGDTYLGLFTTRRTTVTVRGGAPDSLVMPLAESGFMTRPESTATEGPGTLRWHAETWTLAYANSRWVGPGQGTITVLPAPGGAKIVSTLPFDLEDAEVRLGTMPLKIGTLKAGESRVVQWGQDEGYGLPTSEPVFTHLMRYPDEGRGHFDHQGWGMVAGIVRGGVEDLGIEGLAPESQSVTLVRAPFAMPTELDPWPESTSYLNIQQTTFEGAYP